MTGVGALHSPQFQQFRHLCEAGLLEKLVGCKVDRQSFSRNSAPMWGILIEGGIARNRSFSASAALPTAGETAKRIYGLIGLDQP